MKRLFAQVASAAFFIAPALAEPQYPTTPPAPPPPPVVILDPATGLPLGTASNPMNVTGGGSGGSFTGYTAAAYATPISAGTGSQRVAIPGPGNTTVVLFNTSTTQAAFSTIGNGSAAAAVTMDQISPGGCWAYNVLTNVDVAAITAANTATINVSAGTGWPLGCGGGGGTGGPGTVAQGNAGSNAQAWWARIGDGTNGPAAVKPASTAPLATDPALVVTLSPNSPGSGFSGNVAVTNNSSSPIPMYNTNLNTTYVTPQGTFPVTVIGQIFGTKTVPIAITSANTPTTVVVLAGSPGLISYLTTLAVESASGNAFSVEEGTGTACGTNTIVLTGNMPMTGQLTGANGGASPTIQTQVAGDDLCFVVTTLQAYGGWMQEVQR